MVIQVIKVFLYGITVKLACINLLLSLTWLFLAMTSCHMLITYAGNKYVELEIQNYGGE